MQATDLVFETADGVLAVDQDQRIVLWNGGAYAILGFQPEEVLGLHCYEVLGGRDEAGESICRAHCQHLLLMRHQKLAQAHDVLFRCKSGQDRWVNLSTIRVPSRRRDLSVLVHLFRDVGRQKETERLVDQLLADVEKFELRQRADPPATSLARAPVPELTHREREALRILFSGASTQVVAQKLGISQATARNHINNILGKLGVHSRLEAVTLAMRIGVI